MPPTPKLSAKPSPTSSTSQPKALMLTPPFLSAGGCDDDDDDDFQSPLQPHRARPLKPSNGAASRRPRKKPRTSSSGKENRPVAGGAASEERVAVEAVAGAGTLALGARGCSGDVPEEKDATGSRKGKLSCGIGICTGKSCSNLMGLGFLDTDAPCDLGCRDGDEAQEVGSRVCSSVPEERYAVLKAERCGLPSKEKNWSDSGSCKGNYHLNLIELGFPELDASCEFGVADHKEERELGSTIYSSVSEERNAEMEDKVPSQFETKENECSGFGVHEANCHLNSIESELLESNAQYGFGGGHCDEAQEIGLCACNLVSEEMNVVAEDCVTPEVVISEKKSSVFEACKGSYCLNSIESKLLESSVNCSLQGDDFEIGTQLGELINLCMKDDVEGDSKSRASPLQGNKMVREMFESDCQVECPMCGSDISDLSEELRQMHTNDCLDKDEPAQETNSNNEIKSHASGENVENRRVVEWLRNLGLSRYEEVFVREEVDWETLHWLTEEDLLGMGITSLGPRKKIIHALGDLRKKDHVNDVEDNVLNSSNTDKSKLPMTANKLITEYFPCSPFNKRRACKLSKPSNLNSRKNSSANKATSRSCAGKGKVKGIPCWCSIPGTPFLVDAFRFLRGDCCHWFLTHFHLDHYQGLTRSFCHGKIYCSSITARLVNHKIGVPWDRLHVLPLNQKITIAGVNLTCFDANHCPGSIIILFEPPNGKAVLHTGDFRFSSEMANNPVLQSCHIHTLILDTTYCNPRYDFPSQETVIQFVIEAIQAEAFNPKTLFLIGSYTIGKERLFMEVARLLQKKIYVGAAKLQILKRLELPEEVVHWFTENEMESHIHVVPMWTLASFKRMKHLSKQYTDRFELIVAFSPTGWTFGKGRKKTPGRRWQQGTIIRYEVPYSEHSSFTELREFVKFISPEHIIPSVNNDGLESADTMLAQLSSDSQNSSNCPS